MFGSALNTDWRKKAFKLKMQGLYWTLIREIRLSCPHWWRKQAFTLEMEHWERKEMHIEKLSVHLPWTIARVNKISRKAYTTISKLFNRKILRMFDLFLTAVHKHWKACRDKACQHPSLSFIHSHYGFSELCLLFTFLFRFFLFCLFQPIFRARRNSSHRSSL